MASVHVSIWSAPSIKAIAEDRFSPPNNADMIVALCMTGVNARNRSVSESDWSCMVSMLIPAAFNCLTASAVGACIFRIVFRRAIPPSEPFFPALSSSWIAEFVSAKSTPNVFATLPVCFNASATSLISADPSTVPAAMIFIYSVMVRAAFIGSSRDT